MRSFFVMGLGFLFLSAAGSTAAEIVQPVTPTEFQCRFLRARGKDHNRYCTASFSLARSVDSKQALGTLYKSSSPTDQAAYVVRCGDDSIFEGPDTISGSSFNSADPGLGMSIVTAVTSTIPVVAQYPTIYIDGFIFSTRQDVFDAQLRLEQGGRVLRGTCEAR